MKIFTSCKLWKVMSIRQKRIKKINFFREAFKLLNREAIKQGNSTRKLTLLCMWNKPSKPLTEVSHSERLPAAASSATHFIERLPAVSSATHFIERLPAASSATHFITETLKETHKTRP